MKTEHKLGHGVRKNPVKGRLMSQESWDTAYAHNWQQGSAIVVTSPEVSDLVRFSTIIENAGQGIDMHGDRVIVSQNVVDNAYIGMKAMHGSRHVLILGNQFVKTGLWASV